MIPLKMTLKSVIKGLKIATREAEKLEKILDKMDLEQRAPRKRAAGAARKPAAKKKPVSRAAGKAKRETAVDAIIAVINRSRKGVTTTQIKQKTGFNDKKIWDIVNRLKRQGRIKSIKRGIYEKA